MSNETPVPETQLTVVVRESGLELESARNVLAVFAPLLEQAEDWKNKVAEIKVTDVAQVREMQLARVSRLALKEIRVNAEKARKKLKEDSLRRGKAIDGAYNIIEFIIAPLEKHLEEQEKFAERKEAARKAELLKSRTEELLPYGVEVGFYRLEDMDEISFQKLLHTSKAQDEERRLAAVKADEERIAREAAQRQEQERIRLDNERLKKEAAEREAAQAVERKRLEEEYNKQAEITRQERLKEQAAREIERQKLQAEREAAEKKAADERAARVKLEEAEAARVKAEKERAAKEEAQRKDAAKAPDRDKLKAFAAKIRALELPNISDPAANAALKDTFRGLADYVETLL